MLAALLLFALSAPVHAGVVELLPAPPIVADGEASARVALRVPGLAADDRLKVRADDAEITAVTRGEDGLVVLHLRPPEAYRADTLNVRISVRGSMKLDEDVKVPLQPPPRGELALTFSMDSLAAGSKEKVTVTITPQGEHPLAMSARAFGLNASEGSLSAPARGEDGAWTATWTPPSKVQNPTNVLFTATDLTTPEQVHGLATFPLLAEKTLEIDAPPDTQNILVIGQAQYGPVGSSAAGKVSITAKLDPRVTQATLQTVDATARRTDSSVPLELGSQPQMQFAPLAERLPTGREMRLWLAVIQANGRAYSGAAPTLSDGTEGRNEGQGWFSFPVTTPTDPGAWSVTAKAGEALTATFSAEIIDAVPRLTVSANPPALAEGESSFVVTVGLKDADGKGLTKRKLRFEAEGAKASGATKDNGDGTYSQAFKLSGAELAEVAVRPVLEATGLPPARLVAWPIEGSVTADGSSSVDVRVLALDAYGLPVAGVALAASAPIGDGAVAPSAKTDANGLATISYRAGTQPGPAALRLDAQGLAAVTLIWQRAEGASPYEAEPLGDDPTVEAVARWRGVAPGVRVGRAGADVGPPAAVTLRTVPSYTTPGAAILVTLTVSDAAGKAVLDAAPTLVSSVGTVGVMNNNGDGSFNVPLQLPPGVDGPLTLTAGAASATGSLSLPTLGQMSVGGATSSSGSSAAASGGSGRVSGGGGGGGSSSGAALRARVAVTDTLYKSTAVDLDGYELLPPEAGFTVPAGVIGLTIDLSFFPSSGNVGLDLRSRLGAYRVNIAGENQSDGIYPTMLGGRYRMSIADGVYAYGGAWAHVFDAAWFQYIDTTYTGAELQNELVIGGRVGGGLQIEKGPAHVRLEVAETFAPLPAMSHAGLALDVVVYDVSGTTITFSALGGIDQQHVRFPVNDDGDRVRVRARQPYIGLGAGVAL